MPWRQSTIPLSGITSFWKTAIIGLWMKKSVIAHNASRSSGVWREFSMSFISLTWLLMSPRRELLENPLLILNSWGVSNLFHFGLPTCPLCWSWIVGAYLICSVLAYLPLRGFSTCHSPMGHIVVDFVIFWLAFILLTLQPLKKKWWYFYLSYYTIFPVWSIYFALPVRGQKKLNLTLGKISLLKITHFLLKLIFFKFFVWFLAL